MRTRREFLEGLGALSTAVLMPGVARMAQATAEQAPGASVVAIVKGKDVNKMVSKAIELVGGLKDLVHDGNKVVIKPNLTNYFSPKDVGTGMTTDVRVVQAVVELIRKQAQCKITFAEGSGLPADVVFEAYGYTKLAKQLGIELVDLAKDRRVPVRIDGLGAKEYMMPVTTLQCDVLINVPVLKTHQLTGITVAMKNLYGLFKVPRQKFHRLVDEHLCDIAGMKKSDLIVVDGLVGMEGQGPLRGTPVKMDLIVASRDIVAVDAVSSAIMGHDPKYLKHLQYAKEKGLGENDLGKITIAGVPVEKVKRQFKPAMFTVLYSHPKSEQTVKKLRAAISYPGLAFTFAPDSMKLDPSKYPLLTSRMFVATIDDQCDRIQFIVPCEAHLRHAVMEELQNWMKEKAAPQLK